MSKKLYFLISFVLVLVLAGNVLAYDTLSWDNNSLAGDQLWRTGGNWDIVGGPSTDYKVPAAADWVGVDDFAYPDPCHYPIIDACATAVGNWIGMGELAAGPATEVMLKMTGGTLTAGAWFEIGGYYTGTFRFDISGGTMTAPYMWIGYQLLSTVTFNMSGGTINTEEALSIGTFDTSRADMNMTGGDVNLGGWLEIGAYRTPRGGIGHVDLHGGTIETAFLSMGGGGVGTMDLAGGTLIIDGDYRGPNGYLFDPVVDDPNNQGEHTGTIAILANRGIITSYGTNVGAIINSGGKYPSVDGLRAVVNFDYNNINAGQTTLTAGAVDSNLAWDPDPLFGSGDLVALDINLISWAAGDNAASHDVYFGTSFAEVNDANNSLPVGTSAYKGNQALADINYPVDVTWQTTYYWRIDEVNNPTWKGTVWNFVTRPARARNPSPTGGGISPLATLTWDPGPVVAAVNGHYVYFSTDANAVRDRDPNVLTIRSPNDLDPNILPFSTQYFWAVDEFNGVETPTTWPSPRWQFTTAGYLAVDTMERYLNIEDIKAFYGGPWNDWSTDAALRSDIYIETRARFINNGDVSMMYNYNNDKVLSDTTGYSEAWALASDLEAGTDWNMIGIELLAVNFMGKASNTKPQPLYLIVSDGTNEGMVTYDDMNGVQEENWHTWWIEIKDPCFTTGASPGPVDMNNVDKVYLGIGVRGHVVTGPTTGGGEGDVYFDDIRLYPSICVSSKVETDISGGCIWGDCVTYGNAGDCITNYADLDVMAGDWLEYDYNVPALAITSGPNLIGRWSFDEGHPSNYAYDTSSYGNDGTIIQADWAKTDGYPGDPNDESMHFDGDSFATFDHVICAERTGDGNKPGDYPAELMPTAFTAACWLRISEGAGLVSENYYDTLIVNGLDEGEQSAKNCGFYLTTEDDWMSTDDRAVFILGISIQDVNGYGEEWYPRTPINYPVGMWYHFAATYDANTVHLYVDGKLTTTSNVGGPLNWLYNGKFPEHLIIGGLPVENSTDWFFFDGNIDEVRLYDYALSYGQIVTLAEQGPSVYHGMISPANFSDDEAKFSKIIDFKDYRILADHWLEGPIYWP